LAAGPNLRLGQLVTGPRADAIRRALEVAAVVSTPVLAENGVKTVGFALGPPAAPAGTVVYREVVIRPDTPSATTEFAPFSELEGSLYASPTPDPSQLVLTSANPGRPPTRGSCERVSAYLTKPVRQSELLDTITSALAVRDAATTESPAPIPEPVAPSGAGVRVLVAEDNPVNQKVAAAMLKRLGYRVDVVANGTEAVDAVEGVPYAAVLMDCQMPGAERLRGHRRDPGAGAPDPRPPRADRRADRLRHQRRRGALPGSRDGRVRDQARDRRRVG
jgi:CheY-like chemotaxis protein